MNTLISSAASPFKKMLNSGSKKYSALLILIAASFLIWSAASAGAFEVVAVKSSDIKPYDDALEGFKKTCNCKVREIGNLGEGQGLLEKISRISPDAVLAIGTDAFKKVVAIKDLPVIYTMVMPAEVDRLSQENISGVSMDVSPETCINTIVEIFPKAKRIGLIYNPRHTGTFVKKAVESARRRGVSTVSKIAHDQPEIPALVNEMRGKIDVLWMLPDSTVVNPETVDYMLLFSFQTGVPVFTFSRKYVEMGALAALDVTPLDMGAQAGEIARTVHKDHGTPIRVYARKTLLTINNKVAKKLGINIKDEIIRRAQIIE